MTRDKEIAELREIAQEKYEGDCRVTRIISDCESGVAKKALAIIDSLEAENKEKWRNAIKACFDHLMVIAVNQRLNNGNDCGLQEIAEEMLDSLDEERAVEWRNLNEVIVENKELKEKLETARKSLTEIAKEPDKHDLYGEIVKWNIEEATYALEKITGDKNESN